MRNRIIILSAKIFLIFLMVLFIPIYQTIAADNVTLKVVGLYSETDAGYVSYRIGTGKWIEIKIGDQIPINAEISISVDRDWVELSPSNNPNAVYEITGSEKGPIIKKVTDILKGKTKTVSFPKAQDKPDPKFTNKMVVKQYWGRQMYKQSDTGSWNDIKYGDILDTNATVNIIAINNTLNLVFANGKETKVVGPLKFKVEKLLKGENLYKYLNVAK
jgi:hypothetical protein